MLSNVMALINDSIVNCSLWFHNIIVASGVGDIFLAFVFIYFSVKFIIQPVFGKGLGSDRARKKSSSSGDSDE